VEGAWFISELRCRACVFGARNFIARAGRDASAQARAFSSGGEIVPQKQAKHDVIVAPASQVPGNSALCR